MFTEPSVGLQNLINQNRTLQATLTIRHTKLKQTNESLDTKGIRTFDANIYFKGIIFIGKGKTVVKGMIVCLRNEEATNSS